MDKFNHKEKNMKKKIMKKSFAIGTAVALSASLIPFNVFASGIGISNLRATSSNHTITLSWDSGVEATGYDIYEGTDLIARINNPSTTLYTIDHLVQNQAHTYTVTEHDLGVDTSASVTETTQNLAKPVVNPVNDSDSVVTGTADVGSTINVTAGEVYLGTGLVGIDGKFSVTIPTQAKDTVLSITAYDPTNNPSDTETVTVTGTPDTTAPAMPIVNPVNDSDTAVTGTAKAGSTINVKSGAILLGTVVAGDDGKFTVNIPAQTKDTVLSITATDASNNESEAASVTVTQAPDTTAPAAPVVNPVNDSDTAVTGTAEAGSTINVKSGTAILGTAVTGDDGKFSVTIPAQAKDTVLSITATDASNNESEAASVTVTQAPDTTAPTAPVVNPVNDSDKVVTGTAEAGSTINVKSGTTILGTSVTGDDGKFSVSIAAQAKDTVLSITATDASNNESEAASVTVTEAPDTTPPGNITDPRLNVGNTEIVLEWTEPKDADYDHLKIYRSEDDGKNYNLITSAPKGTAYYRDSVVENTHYFYKFVSVDKAGNESSGITRDAVADRTPPGPVTNTSVVYHSGVVTIGWTEPSDADYDYVLILRSEDGGKTYSDSVEQAQKGTTTFSDQTIEEGKDYVYELIACDTNGNQATFVNTPSIHIPKTTPPVDNGGNTTTPPSNGGTTTPPDNGGTVKPPVDNGGTKPPTGTTTPPKDNTPPAKVVSDVKNNMKKATSSMKKNDVAVTQKLINQLPNGKEKEDLQKELNAVTTKIEKKASDTMSTATKKVNKTNLEAAQKAINEVVDTKKQKEMQKTLDKIEKPLVDEATVKVAIVKNAKSKTAIANAQKAIDQLPAGQKKTELQKLLDQKKKKK